MKVSELLRSEISSVSGLEGEATVAFGKAQISGIRANLPLLLAANLAGLPVVGWFMLTGGNLVPWVIFALAAVVIGMLALPRVEDVEAPGSMWGVLRRAEGSAVIMGLTWASLPIHSFGLTNPPSSNIWMPILVMTSSLLAYCLASMPSAALLLLGLTFSAFFLPLIDSPNWAGMILFSAAISYFAIFAALIIARYRGLLDLAQHDQDSKRQREIIALLLKDFEQGSKDWLWETDAQDRLVYLTDRLAEVTGRALDELVGKRLNEISGLPQHIGPWQSFHDLLQDHRDVRDIELPVKIAKQRRWWQLTARPIFAANGTFLGYRGVGRDITEAHEARTALVQAKETAERASNAKSQFLNVMSHELRTPLNAIVGFSEIMVQEREGPLGARSYADYAKSIVESSRQLQRIINDILDASRIENSSFKILEQEVDVAELAQVALRNCRQLANDTNVILVGDFQAVRAEIRGDLFRLKQILDNLLTNAIKFTPALGTVELSIRDEEDGSLSFNIQDSGIGIDQKDIERIFEPFVQADVGMNRQFGGTGLGLPIARKLARAHGGEITLQSKLGRGTTVTFRLPAQRVIRETSHSVARKVVAA
jgi:PAS domain S-box-containing protein